MGEFRFECDNHQAKCGHNGEADDQFDWSEDVVVLAALKKRGTVPLAGTYSGYGEVNVGVGSQQKTIALTQFKQYWKFWRHKPDHAVATSIFCRCCWETLSDARPVDLDEVEDLLMTFEDYNKRSRSRVRYRSRSRVRSKSRSKSRPRAGVKSRSKSPRFRKRI